MTPNRWRQIEQLYQSVLKREPGQRAAFLDEACAGDDQLRREVGALLDRSAADFPEGSVLDLTATIPAIDQGHFLPGRQIGSYEILAPLGAGGMGEVYRAKDMKLGREVAIKVLSRALVGDHAHLARFRREAQLLASLNHPNIATVHGLEESGGSYCLVMELVPGQTLAERLAAGPLGVDEVLSICIQIAEALEAAHQKGITHRDIKPANIKVTPQGRVKVLDFGLAKSFAGDDRDRERPDAPTLTAMTQPGVVLGTPAYMSPEQLRGEPIDSRTDIWAFGCVLYELLAGRRPFPGATVAEIIAAVLKSEPDWRALPAETPAKVVDLIRRCLEKDPRQRVQTAREVANELRDLARQASRTVGVRDSPRAFTGDASGTAGREEGFWVAVLPFKHSGANPELTALAEGLTEEIVTGLSRFSYLRVSALSSTLRYDHEAVDVRSAAKELGARYVMTGSLRQAGTRLRIAVQLVDASSGVHLWAETYERTLRPDAIFELQDDIVPRIVSTAADTQGVLPHSMSEAVRGRGPDQLSPYEAVLRSFAHFQRVNAEEHAAARAGLERAVQLAPGYADCWAMLSLIYKEEYTHGFNVRPDPLGRAFSAAQRAIEAAPSNHLAYHALAAVLFFQREIQAFRSAAERAIALNPMDGFTIAYLGFLTAYAGDWVRGCALTEQARSLNPHHPGWYWFAPFFDAYRKGEYRGALDIVPKINMPGFWRTNLALAAAYGQLGEVQAAGNALRALLALRPDFAVVAREELGKWWDPELVERLIDGLRKAGLEIAGKEGDPVIHSLAVLPFANASGDPEMEYLSDGLTESIISNLSQLPQLRVMARSSIFRYKGRDQEPQQAGRALGVGAVLTGKVLQRGETLLISAELVDVEGGWQLWGSQYRRKAGDIFAMEEDIAKEIVEKLRLKLTPEKEKLLARRFTGNVDAYHLYLKGRFYWGKRTEEGLYKAIQHFRQAIDLDPTYALAYAGLAEGYVPLLVYGHLAPKEAAPKALAAARAALEIDPELPEARTVVAGLKASYDWDLEGAEKEIRAALELDPKYPRARQVLAEYLTTTSRFAEAEEEAKQALQLDPLALSLNAFMAMTYFFARQYEDAIEHGRRTVEMDPSFFPGYFYLALAYQFRGKFAEAAAAIEQARVLSNHSTLMIATLGGVFAEWGKQEQARSILRELQELGRRKYVSQVFVAAIYTGLGDHDQALSCLEAAFEDRCFWLLRGVKVDARFDRLREEARFQKLVQRMGLALPSRQDTVHGI